MTLKRILRVKSTVNLSGVFTNTPVEVISSLNMSERLKRASLNIPENGPV